MQSWADLTTREKELFERQLRFRHLLSAKEQFDIEALKINMFCGPLSEAELNQMEYILNQRPETRAKGE